MFYPSPSSEAPAPEWSPVGWAFNVWTWLALLAAVAAFEVFGDPILAGIFLSLKLAGPDFAAGIWLRKDPQPERAVMMSYYSLGRACLKVAGIGAFIAVLMIASGAVFGLNAGMGHAAGGACAVICGLFTAMFLLIGAAAKSKAPNVRPWLDKTIYSHMRRRDWPPRCDGSRNRVPALLVGGMLATSVVLLPMVVGAVFGAKQVGKDAPIAWIVIATFLPLWGWMMWTFVRALRYTARSPNKCWWEESSQLTPTITAPAGSGRSPP